DRVGSRRTAAGVTPDRSRPPAPFGKALRGIGAQTGARPQAPKIGEALARIGFGSDNATVARRNQIAIACALFVACTGDPDDPGEDGGTEASSDSGGSQSGGSQSSGSDSSPGSSSSDG